MPAWSPEELRKALPPDRSSSSKARSRTTKTIRRRVAAAKPDPLPAKYKTLPPKIRKRLAERPGADRSKQTYSLVKGLVSDGYTDDEILEFLTYHGPTIEKWGDDQTDV